MNALKAVKLVESGSPLGQLVGHGFGNSSDVYVVGDLAVKEYLPFERKAEPVVRAKNEYQLLSYAQDIPGVAHNVRLFIRDQRVFLTREAGFKPLQWENQHLLQIQDALVSLVSKQINLNDPVQPLVRKDGSVFIYDFDNGSCETSGNNTWLWQDTNASYQRFLREERIEEHYLIEYLRWDIARIKQLIAGRYMFDKFYPRHLVVLENRLCNELNRFNRKAM